MVEKMKSQSDFKEPPVVIGSEYVSKVIGIGAKGDGIAKVNGFVVILKTPDLQQGQTVKFVVEKVLPNFAIAKVI